MILLSSLYIYRSPETSQRVDGLELATSFMNRLKRDSILRIERNQNCETLHHHRIGKHSVTFDLAYHEFDKQNNVVADDSKVVDLFMLTTDPVNKNGSRSFKAISKFRVMDVKIRLGENTKKGVIISDKEIPELIHFELGRIQTLIEDVN